MADTPSLARVTGPVALRRNLRLYRKAIERCWDVPESEKRAALELAWSAMLDQELAPRDRMEGAKLVMAANGQNIKVDDQLFKLMTAMIAAEKQAGTVNNTLNFTGPAEMFREVITQLRNGNNAAPSPEQADPQPAGDD